MRFLLAILALLTGFSAAQAARPVEAASPTSAASQVEPAEAFSIAIVAGACPHCPASPDTTVRSKDRVSVDFVPVALPATTPVKRADCAHK